MLLFPSVAARDCLYFLCSASPSAVLPRNAAWYGRHGEVEEDLERARGISGVWVCGGTGSPWPWCPSLPLGMASAAEAHTGWQLHYWGSSWHFRSLSLCLTWDSWQAALQRAEVFGDLMAS